jgi:UDP-glucose 4-epimerase
VTSLSHVLVTGGAGFIGSHTVRALLAGGKRVTVLDNLSVGRRESVAPQARLVVGDVRNRASVTDALDGVDSVIHLAAQVTVRGSFERFYEDLDTNVMGTANLLRLLDSSRIRWFTFASSMAVYADQPQPTPIPETGETAPISPYGVGKLAAEQVCRQMLATAGIPLTLLRLFNTFGPGQTMTPYVGVITIFVQRLLRHQPPVIFGDGHQQRDFVHVSDIVDGILAATGSSPGTFNLGSGRPTALNDLGRLLVGRIDPASRIEYAPAHEGEVRFSLADITAARRAFGYQPRRSLDSHLDEIVADLKARLQTVDDTDRR